MKRSSKQRTLRITLLFLLPVLLLLSGCSGATWYQLTVDGLTFLSPEERSRSINFDTSSTKHLYFLPYFGQYEDTSSITAEIQHGFLVEYPVPDLPDTGSGEIGAKIEAAFDLKTNVNTSGTLEIYLAKASSDNIYQNSIVREEISLPSEEGVVSLTVEIAKGDPAFDLLRTGKFRCGVKMTVSAGSNPSFEYTVDTLRISVEARPFSYIP